MSLFTACGGEQIPHDVYMPELEFPGALTVIEGGGTSFVLSTTDFSHGDAVGRIVSFDATVTPCPDTFALSPSSPSMTVAVNAAVDSAATDRRALLQIGVDGAIGAPGMQVLVVDPSAANILADPWALMLSLPGTSSFAVKLSQQPSASVTVTAQSARTDLATASPSTLIFGPSDYDVPQIATVQAVASGTTSILLSSSSQLPNVSVLVTVE